MSLAKSTDGVPTAVIDGLGSAADEIVVVDQHRAGRLATEHLIGLGHTAIWHVAGPQAWTDASGRTTGWSAALTEAGLDVPPVLHGDWSPESGHRLGLVLARMPEVTAVFVSSDEMAFGVVRALVESGRRVPEDVSVVGMDDIALARFGSPPLTTVRQPFGELARIAVEHVIDLIDDPHHATEPIVLQADLVVRASTAPPPERTLAGTD